MIALDNGPPNGDYARYLEQLVRERGAGAGRPPAPNATAGAAPPFAPPPGRTTVSPRTVAPIAAQRPLRPDVTTAGATRPAVPTVRPAAASTGPDLPLAKMFGAFVLGAALIVFGLAARPLAWIPVAAGLAALVAAVKPLFAAPVVALGAPPPAKR